MVLEKNLASREEPGVRLGAEFEVRGEWRRGAGGAAREDTAEPWALLGVGVV
jgi:hypothetical protein